MATDSSPPLPPLPSPYPCPPRSFHPLPSALCSPPLLSPLLSSRPTWLLTETDARSAVAGCQQGFVGPCSHLGPLPPPAFLSAADVDGARSSPTPAPLPLSLDVLSSRTPRLSSSRHALRLPRASPGSPHHQGGKGGAPLCGSVFQVFREGVKVLECLPSGSFWTPFW